MRRDEDVALARRLADALEGREPPTGELRAIVRVLEAAAAEARFAVEQDETERALTAARPQPGRRRPRRFTVAVAAAATIAVAAVVVLLSPSGSPLLVNVQARALTALGGPGSVLEVVERVTPGPAGGFAPSTRTGWIDPARARAVWTQRTLAGTVVDETRLERGRITRFDPATASAVVARSCAALTTGCGTAVDPIAVYRAALTRASAAAAHRVTFAGRSAYRFALPVQRLADAVRIAQIVTVDARTLLPERIEWREQPSGGPARTVAVIDIREVRVVDRDLAPADAFTLPLPPGTAITQLAAPGRPVRLLSTRRLTRAEARAVRPRLDWLGPRYVDLPLGAITLYRYNAGVAVRMRYGPLLVWNYGPVVPPRLLANLLVPVKQIPTGSHTARFYSTAGGAFAAELDRRGGTVVLIAPPSVKLSLFTAAGRLRAMPPGGA